MLVIYALLYAYYICLLYMLCFMLIIYAYLLAHIKQESVVNIVDAQHDNNNDRVDD